MAATAVVLGLGGYLTLTAPATTRRGVDFQLDVQSVPTYVKAVDFLHRHFQYQLLASQIAGERPTETERVLAVFDWTRRNIPTTPPGWPVVDDHILHIIIRGHGVADQQADVFTTLATYSGAPAFWASVPGHDIPHVILSFARVHGRWRVFDVANGFVFRTRAGDLATMEDLARDPELIPAAARAIVVGTKAYTDVVSGARMPVVPRALRAELQMPWRRAWYELRRVLAAGNDEGMRSSQER